MIDGEVNLISVETPNKESIVSWKELRSSNYTELVEDLDKDIQNKVDFSPEQVEGLICYWLEYKAYNEVELPWPTQLGEQEWGNKAKNDDGEITGQDLYDKLKQICENLNQEDLEKVSMFVLDNFESLTANLEDTETDIYNLEKITLGGISWTSESGKRVGYKLAQKMSEFASRGGSHYSYAGPEWSFVYAMGLESKESESMRRILYRAMASDSSIDIEKKKLAMGLVMSNYEPSREFNTLREMMTTKDVPAEERDNVAKFLGQLLGLPEGAEVYKSLSDCYASMSFEKYPVSDTTKPIREKFLSDLVKKLNINPSEKVLDIATGSGWLTDVMKKAGLPNSWGLDINAGLLNVAKATLGNYFLASRWDNLPFATEQLAMVTCLGRSLPHCENHNQFDAALSEMVRVLEKGGTLVFDMPDSGVGTYKQAIERHRDMLRSFGCSDEVIENSWIIVDGPKGDKDHFYNRYAPSREVIERTVKALGLDVEIIEEDIPNAEGQPSGDKNLVFVCKKKLVD